VTQYSPDPISANSTSPTGHLRHHQPSDLIRFERIGVDDVIGDLGVKIFPLQKLLSQGSSATVLEQRSWFTARCDPVGERGDAGSEPDDLTVIPEKGPIRLGEDDPTAGGDHGGGPAEQGTEGATLEFPERRLTLLGEDLPHRALRDPGDRGVGVDGDESEEVCENRRHDRLA